MSSTLAVSLPVTRPVETPERTSPRFVKVVTTRAQRLRRPRVGYAIIASGVVFTIFMAQLLLSIALSGGAYHIAKLQLAQRNYQRVESTLTESLQVLGSTQNLAANADKLGMVNSGTPAYLNLATGRVVGTASKATGTPTAQGKGGAAQSLVPNALLDGVALVTAPSGGSTDGSSGAASTTGSGSPVASTTTTPGALPSPTTH